MTQHGSPRRSLERGYQALAAIQHIQIRELLVLQLRASFVPIAPFDIAPILPCDACHDGGLRVVGTVRRHRMLQRIHVCDTCNVLRFYEIPEPPPRPSP